MPPYLPRARPGNFPEVRGGAGRATRANPSVSPHGPTHAPTVKAAPFAGPRSQLPGLGGARAPDCEPPGRCAGQRASACPRRASRQPPSRPQRHRATAPPPGPLSPAPAAFSPAWEGACEPRRRRRAAFPARSPSALGARNAARTRREGTPAAGGGGSLGRPGGGARGPNLPGLGALASSLSAWAAAAAAAAATAPGAQRGARLRAASAGPDS